MIVRPYTFNVIDGILSLYLENSHLDEKPQDMYILYYSGLVKAVFNFFVTLVFFLKALLKKKRITI